jgi:L-histidine N-alpha-methyltransferase
VVVKSPMSRFELIECDTPDAQQQTLAQAINEGLDKSQKKTPPWALYDERGSELFTRITQTDDYYPTTLERSILKENADEIISAVGPEIVLTEPGAGDCSKTRILLDAVLRDQSDLLFEPIDVSGSQLKKTSNVLLNEYDNMEIKAVSGRYEQSLKQLDPTNKPRLLLFLGSSIGNFSRDDATELLTKFSTFMNETDRILLGVDLLKDRDIIRRAYNDSGGVTAKFNENLLRRINRELGGHFDLGQFEHNAPFVEDKSRIEMRLVSQTAQDVFIEILGSSYSFREGEYIHTESSHKFTLDGFLEMASKANLEADTIWTDDKEYFAEYLLKPSS